MLDFITKKILVPQEEIETIVSRLAEEINRDYADKKLVIAGGSSHTGDYMEYISRMEEIFKNNRYVSDSSKR